jgi:hypothetical protein
VTVQTTAPPPPFPEPLHWRTVETGSLRVVTVVVQVSVPIGPVAPTQRVMLSVEGGVAASAPAAVRYWVTATVQATSVPPPFISPLHCDAVRAALALGADCSAIQPTRTPTASINGIGRKRPFARSDDVAGESFIPPQYHDNTQSKVENYDS